MMKKMTNVKSVITAASRNAQISRLTMKPIIAGYLHGSARFAQAKMLPPGSGYGPAFEPDFHSAARLAAADDSELAGVEGGGEQFVVLAEAQVLVGCAGSERDEVEVDQEPAPRARRDVAGVAGEAVGQVEHRVRVPCKLDPLLDPHRRTGVAPRAEGSAGRAERAADDKLVSRESARPPRHAVGLPDRRHRHEH